MDQETLQRYQEEGRVLKREDELGDISQMPQGLLVKPDVYNKQNQQQPGSMVSTMASVSLENVGEVPHQDESVLTNVPSIHDNMEHDHFYPLRNAGEMPLPTDTLQQGIEKATESLVQGVDKVKEKVSVSAQRAVQGAQEVSHKVAHKAEQLKEQAMERGAELKEEANDVVLNVETQARKASASAIRQAEGLRAKALEFARSVVKEYEEYRKESADFSQDIRDALKEEAREMRCDASDFAHKAARKAEEWEQSVIHVAQEIKEGASRYIKDPFSTIDYSREELHESVQEIREGIQDTKQQVARGINVARQAVHEKTEEIKEDAREFKDDLKREAVSAEHSMSEDLKDAKSGVQGIFQKVVDTVKGWAQGAAGTVNKDYTIVKETVTDEAKVIQKDARALATNLSEDATLLKEVVKEEAVEIEHGAREIMRKAANKLDQLKHRSQVYLGDASKEAQIAREMAAQKTYEAQGEIENLSHNIMNKAHESAKIIQEREEELKAWAEHLADRAVNRYIEMKADVQFKAEQYLSKSELTPEIRAQLRKVNEEIRDRAGQSGQYRQPDAQFQEQYKLVLEDIRQVPRRPEQVFEGQGKARSEQYAGSQGTGRRLSERAQKSIDELSRKLDEKIYGQGMAPKNEEKTYGGIQNEQQNAGGLFQEQSALEQKAQKGINDNDSKLDRIIQGAK